MAMSVGRNSALRFQAREPISQIRINIGPFGPVSVLGRLQEYPPMLNRCLKEVKGTNSHAATCPMALRNKVTRLRLTRRVRTTNYCEPLQSRLSSGRVHPLTTPIRRLLWARTNRHQQIHSLH